jgi:hypothetical protein
MKNKNGIKGFLLTLIGIIILICTIILTELFNLSKILESIIFIIGFISSSLFLSIGTTLSNENE